MSEEVKNPLNGSSNLFEADDDDQEDLFVSTFEGPLTKSTAPVATPAAPEVARTTTTIAPVEDLMNTIDLNDDRPSPIPPTSTGSDESSSTTLTPDKSTPPKSQEPLEPSLPQMSSSPIETVAAAPASFAPSSTSTFSAPPPLVASPPSIPSTPISIQPLVDEGISSSLAGGKSVDAIKPSVHFSLPQEEKKAPPATNTPSQITIQVSDPHKIGDGMSSYMVYTVTTKTTLPYFRKQSLSVNRRFSDFLGLHDKLQEKHSHLGRIVPPPPAKSVVGTAKIKFSKQDEQQASSNEFLEKRRAALERYLQRTAEHPIICADPDFREFLELDADLPRSTSTSALSGAGVKRMFSFVSDTVSKMTYKMDETDTWFEQKQVWIDQLDAQLRKLYSSVESLVHHRKELTVATGSLAKSSAILGNCEEHNSLSCALSQLAATHEKIEKIYERQANNDITYLAELLKDYIALIGSVKEVFQQRVKCFHNLTATEQALTRKREQKVRLEMAMKQDRVGPIEDEIRDLEGKVEKAKEDFETISSNIKQEFDRFELNRIRDFKQNFIRYMETLLESEEALVECWEAFLPESKSIAA